MRCWACSLGQGSGGGLFHQNVDGDISVSDDPGEFDTAVDMEVASTIFRDLEAVQGRL